MALEAERAVEVLGRRVRALDFQVDRSNPEPRSLAQNEHNGGAAEPSAPVGGPDEELVNEPVSATVFETESKGEDDLANCRAREFDEPHAAECRRCEQVADRVARRGLLPRIGLSLR